MHVCDAVRLFRLALEKGCAGARYNAVGEEGVALRDIAGAISAGLKLPTESIPLEQAPEYFGALTHLATHDFAASSVLTRQQLGWTPAGPADRPAQHGLHDVTGRSTDRHVCRKKSPAQPFQRMTAACLRFGSSLLRK